MIDEEEESWYRWKCRGQVPLETTNAETSDPPLRIFQAVCTLASWPSYYTWTRLAA